MQIVPPRVLEETKYMDFLRVEDMDPVRAAERIARYWKLRRQVFGEARWLLPLTQNGAGALTQEDIKHLKTGWLVVHPRPGRDTVIICDNKRLNEAPGTAATLRVGFYLVYAFADEFRQTQNAINMRVITRGRKIPIVHLDKGLSQFNKCHPVKFKLNIFVQSPELNKEAVVESIGYEEKLKFEYKSDTVVTVVTGKSTQDVLRQVEEFGIERECVPTSAGGTYDYSSFYAWIHERTQLENALHGTGVVARSSCLTAATAESPSAEAPTGSEESQKEFLRKRNAMYVRRHYRKQKMEMASNREQIQVFEMRNAQLRNENRRLEQLLAEVHTLVAQHEGRPSKKRSDPSELS